MESKTARDKSLLLSLTCLLSKYLSFFSVLIEERNEENWRGYCTNKVNIIVEIE